MKKMVLMMLLFLGSVCLTGCIEDNNPTETPDVETPEITDTAEYQATIEVYDLNEQLVFTKEITFLEDDPRSTIAILDDQIDIIYTTFDQLGTFIYGVGNFFPKEYGSSFNYQLQIYVDDVKSGVGIDQITLTDGMVLSFKEETMLDDIDQKVDAFIYAFLDTHISTYINDNYIHQDVLAALVKLSLMGYQTPELETLVNEEDLNLYLLTLNLDVIGQAFKKAVIETGFGKDTTETKQAIEAMTPNNSYDATSLLNAFFVLKSEASFIDPIKNQLLEESPEFMDPDYAGMLLVALAPYDTSAHTAVSDMISFIQTNLSNQGIVSWGNANAASTAAVILGLVAQGENPRDLAYTTENIDLIEALLLYETNAAFFWLINDTEADMNFSTPQAFAALVAYKLYRDVYGNPPVYLYDLVDLNNI